MTEALKFKEDPSSAPGNRKWDVFTSDTHEFLGQVVFIDHWHKYCLIPNIHNMTKIAPHKNEIDQFCNSRTRFHEKDKINDEKKS